MGYGTVADEIKGRAPSGPDRAGKVLEIAEAGVRFRSYLDGSEKLLRARDVDGDPGRARLGPRARVRRVHAVPRRPRLHRPLDRAHAPLAAPLPGLARRARAGRASSSTASSRAASTRTCAPSRPRRSRRARSTASRSAARSGPTRPRCTRWSTGRPRSCRRTGPATCSGIGEIDDLIRGVELGIDTFDCAMPTRLGRHGMALVPDPERRWRVDLTGRAVRAQRRAADGGLPVPGLRARAEPRLPAATWPRRASSPACAWSRSTTSRSSRG